MRLLDKPTARTSDAWFANQTDAFFVSSFSQHLQFLLLVGGGQEGIVSRIEASQSIPLNSPFPRGRNVQE